MFFRNLTLQRFSKDAAKQLDNLDEALAEYPLKPCGALEMSTRGFVSPSGDDNNPLTRTIQGYTLICLGGEDKLLPGAVIAKEVRRKTKALLAERGTPVSGKERREIKQAVTDELLPRALSSPSRTSAYIDHKRGWLVIDTTSKKKAEEFTGMLRKALGSFPAMPLTPIHPVRTVLTLCLSTGDVADGFTIGRDCELREPTKDSGAKWRGSSVDLDSEEVHEHLRSGMQVSALGLEYEGRMGFMLDENLVVKKFKLFDVALETLSDTEDENEEQDATFTLMALEVEKLLGKLEKWFGLERPE